MEQGTGLVAGILANHQNKPAAESQALVATVYAITEVLEAQGLPPSPTALFAATLSALNTVEVASTPDVCLYQNTRCPPHAYHRLQPQPAACCHSCFPAYQPACCTAKPPPHCPRSAALPRPTRC